VPGRRPGNVPPSGRRAQARAHSGAEKLGPLSRRLRADRTGGAGRRGARPRQSRSDDVLLEAPAPRSAAEAAGTCVPVGVSLACRAALSSR
jgi:hypothetical protein